MASNFVKILSQSRWVIYPIVGLTNRDASGQALVSGGSVSFTVWSAASWISLASISWTGVAQCEDGVCWNKGQAIEVEVMDDILGVDGNESLLGSKQSGNDHVSGEARREVPTLVVGR